MTSVSRDVIVGVSGVTCGGKTTICEKLQKFIAKSYHIDVINQDDYFKHESEIQVDEMGFTKFDCVEAVDFPRLLNDVKKILYRYQTTPSDYQNVLLVEGHLIFAYEELNELFDHRFMLTLSHEETFRRRQLRTDYDPPDAPGLFQHHVWPEYAKYYKLITNGNFPYVEIDAQQTIDQVFAQVTGNLSNNSKLAL